MASASIKSCLELQPCSFEPQAMPDPLGQQIAVVECTASGQTARRDSGQEMAAEHKDAPYVANSGAFGDQPALGNDEEITRRKTVSEIAQESRDVTEPAFGPIMRTATQRGATRYDEDRRAAMRANGGYRDGWLLVDDPDVKEARKPEPMGGVKQGLGPVLGEAMKLGESVYEECRRAAMRKGGGYCDGWLQLN